MSEIASILAAHTVTLVAHHVSLHTHTHTLHNPLDFAPDMLLCCHHLTQATLDYLMVAQCASLTHRIVVSGWDLMQLPWVKVYAGSGV